MLSSLYFQGLTVDHPGFSRLWASSLWDCLCHRRSSRHETQGSRYGKEPAGSRSSHGSGSFSLRWLPPVIWERDAGVLTKLLVTPALRSALILGKSFAAGIRSLSQVIVVLVLRRDPRRDADTDLLRIAGAFAIVMLAAAFFSCLSMTIAGVVLRQDRLMGIGQMITMPLFLASNALGPVSIMGRWLRDLSRINPLSYEVDGLRGMLVHSNATIGLDVAVLAATVLVGVITASSLVNRLAR
jgi:ABC-2 type transport system permease protein